MAETSQGSAYREKNLIDADFRKQQLSDPMKAIYQMYIMEYNKSIGLDKVILSAENRDKISRLLRETENRDIFREYGLNPINRVLLSGRSGTGKTFTTQIIANHLGYTLLTVDIGTALSQGNICENVSEIFALADELSNCIIFFDECDTVAWAREENHGNEASLLRRATNTIFQKLDTMSSSNMFFAATNMHDRIDAAFKRRFNISLVFEGPDLDLKSCIKQFMSSKFEFVDDCESSLSTIVERRIKESRNTSYYGIEQAVGNVMKDNLLGVDNNTLGKMSSRRVYLEMARSLGINLKAYEGSSNSSNKGSGIIKDY